MKKRKYILLISCCLTAVVLLGVTIFALSNKGKDTPPNENATTTPAITFDLNTENIDAIVSAAQGIKETTDYTEYAIKGNYSGIEGEYKYKIQDGEIIYAEFYYVPMLVKAKEEQTEDGDTIGVYDEEEVAAGYKNVEETIKKITENKDITITRVLEINFESEVKTIEKLPSASQMRDSFINEPKVYTYIIWATTKDGEEHSIAFFTSGFYSIAMSVINKK